MNHKKNFRALAFVALGAASLVLMSSNLRAEDWPMWGRTPQRNMVGPDKNPPTDWDLATGKNVLWSAALGGFAVGFVYGMFGDPLSSQQTCSVKPSTVQTRRSC